MKKKYYLVLDTETATLPFVNEWKLNSKQKQNIAIAKPLVYDLGWVIVDRKGNEIKRENFLIQETFFVPGVFNTAYYRNKRPIYMDLLAKGKIKVEHWDRAILNLLHDLRTCDIACAYNGAFDFKKAIPFTERYIKALYCNDYQAWEDKQRKLCKQIISTGKSDAKNENYLNPIFTLRGEDFPICDLWALSCEKLINIDKYRNYCLENELLTNSGQFFKTSAETSFQYLMKDFDFEESHTALDDSLIEAQILLKALKKGKIEPCMKAFPFRELGTTKDYVIEKKLKYLDTVIKSYENYLENAKESSYKAKLKKELAEMLELLE